MEKMTRSELQKLQILNDLEVVTDKQLAGYVMAATQDIEKSTTAEDTKRTVEKEVSSFRPIEVYDDIDGHIEKSIVFIRPAQIAWTDKENGKGVFKDTPLNRELYRVGDDIQKGKAAVAGEVRTWGGKKYKKQANGKWLEVSDKGMTKKEHQDETNKLIDAQLKNDNFDTRLAAERSYGKWKDKKLSDKEHTDEEVGLGDGDKKSGGETFKLKADMPYMVSLANLRGKELKSKGTKEVSFATGKQTYHVFDVDGEEVEVPERFLDKK